MSKVKMPPAFIVIISCLSVTVYISCIRHCLGAPLYPAYFVDPFSLSTFVNNDHVTIRVMTTVKMHAMYVCLAPSNFWRLNPPWFPRPRQAEYSVEMLARFSVPYYLNLLRLALQD
jgi:hypothetical protein